MGYWDRRRRRAGIAGLLLLILGSCTGKPAGEQTLAEYETEASVPVEESTAEAREETLVLRLGFSTDETDPRAEAAFLFKQTVEAECEGEIRVELYPSGKLGADKELILGVINGTVDMTVSSAGNFASFANVGISAFPFLFHNFDEAWEFMDSPLIRELDEGLKEYNIHVLAHFDNGFRCITTSEEAGPVQSLSDLKDLGIRTSDNQIVMETMAALGARPRSLDFTELYGALERGEFQAQENPVPVIFNHKLYEVQRYLAVTNHSYDAMPFVIREDLWNSLSAGQQDIISRAAVEAQSLNRELNREQTETYGELLEQQGMIITYPEMDEFRSAAEAVYDYFESSYGAELLERVFEQVTKE